MKEYLDQELGMDENRFLALSLAGDPLVGGAALLGMLSLERYRQQFRLDTTNEGAAAPAARPSLPARVRLALREHAAHRAQYRELCETLGARPDIPPRKAADLLAEVERHRWLEAEKAGRDIWVEKEPADPYSAALRDWFVHHYRAWRDFHCRPRANA